MKLYKLIDNQLNYWETFDKDEKTALIHWGIVGQRGEDKIIKSGLFSNFRKIVQKEIDQKTKEGYAEFDEDEMIYIDVEYKIDGFGNEETIAKLERLYEHLNSVLAWTGMGHVDGTSSGSGTMEIGCMVVDLEKAKEVIKVNLEDTEFADYTRIYELGAE